MDLSIFLCWLTYYECNFLCWYLILQTLCTKRLVFVIRGSRDTLQCNNLLRCRPLFYLFDNLWLRLLQDKNKYFLLMRPVIMMAVVLNYRPVVILISMPISQLRALLPRLQTRREQLRDRGIQGTPLLIQMDSPLILVMRVVHHTI